MQVHSAEALLALFNCLQHAVTLVDRDGRVLLANAASGGMWGGRVEAGSEERLLPLLFSHDPAALIEAMAALDQGSTWRGPVQYVGAADVQALHGPDATAGSTGRQPASAAAARRNCSLDLAEGPAARCQEPGGQAAGDPLPSAGSSSLQQRRRVLRRRHSQIALGHGTNSTQTGHSAAGVLEELAAVPPRPAPSKEAPPKEAPPAGAGASATTRPAVAGVTGRAPVRRAISVIALGEVPVLAAPLTVRQQLVAGLQLSAWGPALMRGHQPPLAAAAAAAEGSALMVQRSAASWSDQYAWRNPSAPRRGHASASIIFAAAAAARAAAADIVTAAAEEDVGAETFLGLSTNSLAGAQLVPNIYSSASSGESVRGLGAALAGGPLSAGHQSQPLRSRSYDHVGTVALARAAGSSARDLLAVAGGSVGAGGGTGGSAVLSSGGAGSAVMGRLLSITLQSITRGAAPMAGGAGRQRNASFHLSDLDRIHERQNPLHQHHQHRQDSQHREDRPQQQQPNGHASGPHVSSAHDVAVCDLVLAAQVSDSGDRPLVEPFVPPRHASFHLSDLERIHERQNPLHHHHQYRQNSQYRSQQSDDVGSPVDAIADLVLTAQATDGGGRPLGGADVHSTKPLPPITTLSAVLPSVMRPGAVAAASAGDRPSGPPASEIAATSRMRYGADAVPPQQQPRAWFPQAPLPSAEISAAVAGEAAVQWHEVALTPMMYPGTTPPRPAVLIVQNDVSPRIWAEWQLARVVEAEHTLLENIFPHHVIEHIAVMSSAAPAAADAPFKVGAVSKATDLQQRAAPLSGVRSSAEAGGPDGLACSGRLSSVGALGGADAQATSQLPAIRGETFLHLATSHTAITILFCDIQGFTPLCSQMQPVVVMSFLNDLFTRLDGLLDMYGIYKVETIGDCYVAAGGLMRVDEETGAVTVRSDDVDPQHANNTVQFAKALLRAASRVSLPTTGQPVRLRVGIHSGAAMSGVVGTRMPRFCLFGDTMNVASRMESTGEAGSIHVSQATRDLVPREAWESRGGMEVKGKGIMETYLLRA
ncbi:Soluble guanylate cyclase 88E [Tetrabaena socialis]|uniref:Soluble guanylate cyclase 88E n=1 Tax=Tetrabaena socialis TaxID=47790 RepID=A0A2J8A266_9CHLO|nr:Soluble guanylate cyclase 88E [Tetrabaena socialis]|eukprot:PNH06626.1 Soluble guanylate cyclase 88E [Tetrabaena socialis]